MRSAKSSTASPASLKRHGCVLWLAVLVSRHCLFDRDNHARLALVLEERQKYVLFLAEVCVEQGMEAVQGRLESWRVVDVDCLQHTALLAQKLVVEPHPCGGHGVTKPKGDLRIEQPLLGLGVQEPESLGDDGVALTGTERWNLSRDLRDSHHAWPEAVVSPEKRLCHLVCHRLKHCSIQA